jgi:preprotein translocase YajC subunit
MDSLWIVALAYPAIIAALFYFAFLRPVQQQQKKHRQQLQSLRVGDEVLTQAGFIARIKEVRVPEEHGPTELILDLGGIEVRAVASAITQRLSPEQGNPASAADVTPTEATDSAARPSSRNPSIQARP